MRMADDREIGGCKVKCLHCDADGFCKKFSNAEVVWKCKEDADCEGFLEGTEDEEED